ncbi:stage II sporulation protein M [Clostridium culturomicium]|uniref:stage II sporulation protein M n=1 Tax=Clostridium culturomicium TaxID=1499683 RepID=UPI00058C6EEB|nr:stage II sporulation protein M [Clostridium culturomicium]
MKFKGIFDGANKHFNDNLGYYLLTILFMATGMIVGLYCVKYMQDVDKGSLINYITTISTSSNGEIMATTKIFINTLKNNLPIIIGLWILGLTFIGAPIVLLVNLYKGFSLGFTFSFFIYALKQKGIILALLGVLPQNLIYVPCIIFLSVIALKGSVAGVKEKFSKKYVNSSYTDVRNYTMIYVVTSMIMASGFLIETFLTPVFINMVLKGIGA